LAGRKNNPHIIPRTGKSENLNTFAIEDAQKRILRGRYFVAVSKSTKLVGKEPREEGAWMG
jgi:hypothetical protein